MKVAVTGAGGRLGKALCAILRERAHEVAAWPRTDMDITDTAFLSAALEAIKPAWVINCAAITNVDRCEVDREAALVVNANAVAALASLAESVGARLCQVSTDYVFGGENGRAPFKEEDEPAPVNYYGRTKLLAEEIALRCEGAMVARVALIYGDAAVPSFVEKVFERALADQEIQASSEIAGSPSYAPEIARAIAGLCEAGRGGTWHVAGAGGCSRHDLARIAAEAVKKGAAALVRDVPADGLGFMAARPRDSSLSAAKLERDGGSGGLRRWEQSVVEWAERWKAQKAAPPASAPAPA